MGHLDMLCDPHLSPRDSVDPMATFTSQPLVSLKLKRTRRRTMGSATPTSSLSLVSLLLLAASTAAFVSLTLASDSAAVVAAGGKSAASSSSPVATGAAAAASSVSSASSSASSSSASASSAERAAESAAGGTASAENNNNVADLEETKKDWSPGHHAVAASSSSSSSTTSSSPSASSPGIALAGLRRMRYRTLYACEGNSLEIVCDPGTHINLIRANFGRFSISVCNEHGNVEWSVDCMSHRSFKVIQERCASRSRCNLEASVATFGEDACPKVHKYLEVHFNCTAPGSVRGKGQQSSPGGHLAQPQVLSDNQTQAQLSPSPSERHHHHHHHPAITPPLIFQGLPEPMLPNPSHQHKDKSHGHHHNHHQASSIPPPRFVDLTPFDTKEAEEAAGAGIMGPPSSVGSPQMTFPDGPIVVRPPHPNDFSSSKDADNFDSGESDYHHRPMEATPPSPSRHPLTQRPITIDPNGVAPTARPPKPHNWSPNDERRTEHPNVEHTSATAASNGQQQQQPHGNNNNKEDDMIIDEEEDVVVVQPPMPSFELVYDHCHPMYAKGLNWNWTAAGQVAMQPCPAGTEGLARWSCTMDGVGGRGAHQASPTWTPHLPDMSNCSSLWVTHLLARIHSHRDSVLTLAEELAKNAKGKILYSGDLIRTADIIRQLVVRLESLLEETKDDGQDRRAHVIKELLNSVLNVASNLLEESQMESWYELNPQDQRLAISSMTGALENVAQLLADVRSQSNYNYVRTHNNILVSVHVHALAALDNGIRLPLVLSQYESRSPSMTDAAPEEVTAYLPYEALVEHANELGQVKVVFVMYRHLAGLLKPRQSFEAYASFQSPYTQSVPEIDTYSSQRQQQVGQPAYYAQQQQQQQQRLSTIVNSDIVGLILASDRSYDRLSTPLAAPLELTLRHLQVDNITNGRCAFWDIKRSDWSTAGCETVSSNRTHTVCRCNHLTNFAVLVDVSNVTNESALRLLTRIGCIISIVALAATLFTLCAYRSLGSIRNSIHKHLCACLLIAELIFVLGIDETRVKVVCGLIALALHYFFLASFLWMFFEGLQLYTMLVQVFEHRTNRLAYYTGIAYCAPAVLVIIAAIVDPLSYGTSDHCWLRTDNHFVWSFLGPALAVLLANVLFLALAMAVMCKHSPAGIMTGNNTFAVHHQKTAQQQLKVYPSPLTSSPSYSFGEPNKFSSFKIWVRTSLALVVVLGLTWTFGVLYLTHSSLFLAYLFTIFNSLQGLFIFIFCCLLSDKVRAEYRSSLTRLMRRCLFLRPFEPSSHLSFGNNTKSSTDSSTRSTSLRNGVAVDHHLMMAAAGQVPHHLSQQHLYMQQPAASYLGSRNAAPRNSLLYLNELLAGGGKVSEAPTAVSTPTIDQPLIPTQVLGQSHHASQQQANGEIPLSSLSQINLPDDASTSDYGCRRLTQMIEHIYECIDDDPYVAKLLLPAIQRSLAQQQQRGGTRARGASLLESNFQADGQTNTNLALLATMSRNSQRVGEVATMRLQPNSSYLSSNGHHQTLHQNGHLPAIIRDNINGKANGTSTVVMMNGHGQQQPQTQTIAMLDGDQVRCCTLSDHKLCDHQTIIGSEQLMANGQMIKQQQRHLASEC